MILEELSTSNIESLAHLFTEMWPDCTFDEEFAYCSEILKDKHKTAFLVHNQDSYIAFAYLALRYDFVEGAKNYPIAYLEGIYVQEPYRKKGVAYKLIHKAEEWAQQMNCTQLGSDAELANIISINFHKKAGFNEINRVVCFAKTLT